MLVLIALACAGHPGDLEPADAIDLAGVYAVGDGYALPGDVDADCNSLGRGYCYDVVVLDTDGAAWTYRVIDGAEGEPSDLDPWTTWELECDTSACEGLWWGDTFLRPWPR